MVATALLDDAGRQRKAAFDSPAPARTPVAEDGEFYWQNEEMRAFDDLIKCDFRCSMAVLELSNRLSLANWRPIRVTHPDHKFYLAVDPQALDSDDIAPLPVGGEWVETTGDDIHTCFLRLTLSGPTTAEAPAAGARTPSFIFPLGKLLQRGTSDEVSKWGGDLEDTGYVVVLDAISPDKDVWIVFNTSTLNEMGDYVPVDPSRTRNRLPGVEKNFAMAQVAPSFRDWVDRRCGGKDMMENMQRTMRFGTTELGLVSEADVAAAFKAVSR